MNYIWETVLQAEKNNKRRDELHFVDAVNPSPYMEVSFVDLNLKTPEEEIIEVNPLYRLQDVFGKLFDKNIEGMLQTRELFFDVCLHYIAQLDLREGISKEDYYYEALKQDIEQGRYGIYTKEDFQLFEKKEQKIVLRFYLQLLKTRNYQEIFKKVIVALYPCAYVYESNETDDELLVYLGVTKTEEEERRVTFLKDMFLPLREMVYFFYEHHFGIIGVDETMMIDEMVLF